MPTIPKNPSASKDSYAKVNWDANKGRYHNDFGRDQPPKRTDCTGGDFAGPGGIAQSTSGIQAAVPSEEQGYGSARKDAAEDGERMVTAALGSSFHHG